MASVIAALGMTAYRIKTSSTNSTDFIFAILLLVNLCKLAQASVQCGGMKHRQIFPLNFCDFLLFHFNTLHGRVNLNINDVELP